MTRSASGRQPGDAYVPTGLIVEVFGEDNRFGSNIGLGTPPARASYRSRRAPASTCSQPSCKSEGCWDTLERKIASQGPGQWVACVAMWR